MKFLYGSFWQYTVVDLLGNLGFAYILLDYFYGNRSIFQFINMTAFLTFLILSMRGLLLYGYQVWQEDALISYKKITSSNLQPAATKPLDKENAKK